MLNWFGPLAVLLAAAAFYFGLHYLNKRFPTWGGRAVALAVAAGIFFAYMMKEPAIYDVIKLTTNSPFGENAAARTALSVLLVWFSYAAMFCAILSPFYPYRTPHNINRFFTPVLLVLDLVCFRTYATALMGADVFERFDIRVPFFLLGLAFTLAVALRDWLADYTLPTRKELLSLLYILPFALLCLTPAYAPQAFFGLASPALKFRDFTPEHRLMLYGAFILPILIFHALKDKSEDVKRFALTYLSVGVLFTFVGRWQWASFASPSAWPLHLCHTAMFLVPICLIFRTKGLYNFCLFINVIGALLAMLMPGELDGWNMMERSNIIFWINHYAAFFLPILPVVLKLFPRPKFRDWCISLGILIVYFGAMVFCNPWFEAKTGEKFDFFYTNGDFIVSGLGKWAEKTQDLVIHVNVGGNDLYFMPIYQSLFILIFIAMTVALWFVYSTMFSILDAGEDRREREKSYRMMKKELTEYLGTKHIDEPISGDGSPSLVLRNFSKRYGSNKHYSANNVSFEVRGGEIFGFLGPNGAGKSTCIKSIVGIQPLTSGDIEICGYHVEKQAVQAKLRTGFVPDHYALYENLTGREYINYIADLYQVSREERDAIIEKLVTRFQLTDSFDNQMKTYSHGMKQKITIMAALVHNPPVWILDEPLTGLDPNSIHEVKMCMKEHAAAGNIVFFSSHIIDVVEKICDRIAIIKKGKLRACRRIDELEAEGIELEQFYLSIIEAPDEEVAEAPATEEEPTA